MKRIAILFFSLLYYQFAPGQLIDKNKAIEIAKENGLKQGIEAPVIELKENVWIINNLLCDDTEDYYQAIEVDANTGEVKSERGLINMSVVVGGQSRQTKIEHPENWDDIPVKKSKNPYLLKTPAIGRECNPEVSPNSRFIAFQYKNRRIGIINVDGKKFQPVCSDCMYPQWIDNEWLAYLNDRNQIVKKNLKTFEEEVLTETNVIDYRVSPDCKWIAYTSSEVWHAQNKDISEMPVIILSVNGQDQDLCLLSMEDKTKRYITKIMKYVNSPCWSEKGDTLFFNIENATYFVADLERDSLNYLPAERLDQIALMDYQKAVKGLFPLKHQCKIYAINKNTFMPEYSLNEEPGRYGDLLFTHDLKNLVFTKQAFKNSDKELWVQELD